MTDNQNYYQVLGIDENASADQIKAAYRKLAFKYHPDHNGKDPSALKKFKLIAIAYQILTNPQKREEYDRTNTRRTQKPRYSEPGGFEAFYSSFGPMTEPAPGTAPPTQDPVPTKSKPGTHLRYDLNLNVMEAFVGIKKDISVQHYVTCRNCRGQGTETVYIKQVCKKCNGTGRLDPGFGMLSNRRNCPFCQGAGQFNTTPCVACKGRTLVPEIKKVSINIPAGVAAGTRMRLTGQGGPGLYGGPPGDLDIFIHVEAHDVFKRHKDVTHATHSARSRCTSDFLLKSSFRSRFANGRKLLKTKMSQVTLLILIATAVMVSGMFWPMQWRTHHRPTVPASKIVRGKVPPLPSKATIASPKQETGRFATLNRSITANYPLQNSEQTTVIKSQCSNIKISNKQKSEPQVLRKTAVSSAKPPVGVQTAANLQSQPPAPIAQMPAKSIAGRAFSDDSKENGASEPGTQATRRRHTKTKSFTIQVGAYRVKKNAERQMAQLKNRGYAAYIFETRDARKRKWYFVHLNQFENRKNADAFLHMFKKMEKMSAYIRPLHAAIEKFRGQLTRDR